MDGPRLDRTPQLVPQLDRDYQLTDNLIREDGRIFLTGTQALVRILVCQRRKDRARGLNTAGFVSGYRGSPLGGVDMAMWKAQAVLDAHQITFVPGINEDLAATAVMGTQQVEGRSDQKVDGVFALWYGKGPGVDRAGDALHHGHAAGASRHGGVLVVVGDDHTAVSSSIPHASEASLIGWQMPFVHPTSVDEYETFALWGWALSRYSGAWVAFKAVSETVESGQAYSPLPASHYDMPADTEFDPQELTHTAREFLSPAVELRMQRRLKAVRSFARRHSIDKLVCPAPHATVGLVTVGKAHLDAMEALAQLRVDPRARHSPVRIYKPGLTWPLDADRLYKFAQGLSHILVIEEKGAVVESQIKDLLYNRPARPQVIGKSAADGTPLIPCTGQLRPSLLMAPLAEWLGEAGGIRGLVIPDTATPVAARSNDADGMRRSPYFCSGCPHNSSTKVPEGSQALAGVGCHYMATGMDRQTSGLTQMGGEGADWIGLARYIEMPHIFQNMGEGTYYHSGYLAIRQAVAARANITYKILFNDAVAMTGGQPVDGPISVAQICQQLQGENVARIVITTDDPAKYREIALPTGVTVHHRRELDAVQRTLRDTAGVTILIHDQTCAAEKRRRRKKQQYPDPARRLLINSAVCEGCGDCGVQSNCLSIVPKETPYGRKREIDQSSCNKDFSCVDGFCPSFVSVLGGKLRTSRPTSDAPLYASSPSAPQSPAWQAHLKTLPMPGDQAPDQPYRLLVAGIGGTGVITIGAIVSMAAHLQGLSVSVLDMTGLAQKGGTVISHLRLAPAQAPDGPVRLDWQQADAAIVCDPVAGTAQDALGALRPGHTHAIVNSYVAPVSEFTRNPDVPLRQDALIEKIRHAVGTHHLAAIDAHQAALALFGDAILSNMFMLGYAWQRNHVPLSHAALMRAIELNGVSVDANREAFEAGRLAAHDPDALAPALRPPGQVVHLHIPETYEQVVSRCVQELTAYQSAAYAREYQQLVERVAQRERELVPTGRSLKLATAVARNLFKLMAYKDEYEVARLYTNGDFQRQLREQFEGDYTLQFHMAPPVLARKDPQTGIPRKIALGPVMMPLMGVLARCKRLRGTWLDPFGHNAERRLERALIAQYRETIDSLLAHVSPINLTHAIKIAVLPDVVRGFGHVKMANAEKFQGALALEMQRYISPRESDDLALKRA